MPHSQEARPKIGRINQQCKYLPGKKELQASFSSEQTDSRIKSMKLLMQITVVRAGSRFRKSKL